MWDANFLPDIFYGSYWVAKALDEIPPHHRGRSDQ
jgi:hypothetical protein